MTNKFIDSLKNLEMLFDDVVAEGADISKYPTLLDRVLVEGVYNQTRGIEILPPQSMDFLNRALNGNARFDIEEALRLNQFLPMIYKVIKYTEAISTEDAMAILQVLKTY